MTTLIALALGAALLYFWLVGHWFARVLMFLALLAAAAFIALAAAQNSPADVGAPLFTFAAGGVIAWYASRLPLYYWRWNQKNIYLRGLEMLNPKADPAELRKSVKQLYGRG